MCVCVIVCFMCVFMCVFMYVSFKYVSFKYVSFMCVQSYGCVCFMFSDICVCVLSCIGLGESGFVKDVFKNNGFVERVGIGDRVLMSRALNFIMDCGNEIVNGDVVMWISDGFVWSYCVVLLLFLFCCFVIVCCVIVFVCVGGFAFVGVGVRAPDGIFAGEAHFAVGGCTGFFVGVAVRAAAFAFCP